MIDDGFTTPPLDFKRYCTWAEEHNHVVQVSFQRSGRVWIGSLVAWLCSKDGSFRMPLDNKVYDVNRMSEQVYYTTHLYKTFRLFDNAKYILLVRDPRSVISSYIAWVNRYEDTNFDGSVRMPEWIKRWKLYIELLLPMNTRVVQYEKMCLDPERELNRILDFTGFQPINTFDHLRKTKVLSDESGIERYQKYCLKWKTNEKMIGGYNDLIWDELKDVMLKFGYTKEGGFLDGG